MNNRQLGKIKEDQASSYLEDLGYKIIARNWHYGKYGEIDIVAIDPKRFNNEFLVFIEVKYRSHSLDLSLQALSPHKLKRLQRLAQAFMKFKKINENSTNISFDFIAINKGKISHLKNIV